MSLARKIETYSHKNQTKVYGSKDSSMIWFFLISHGIFLMAFLAYLGFQKSNPKADIDVAKELVKQSLNTSYYNQFPKLMLADFLLNINSNSGRILARLDLEVYAESKEVLSEIHHLREKMRRFILLMLSSKKETDFSNSITLQEIQRQIKKKINLFLTKGQILEIRLKNFEKV